MHCLYLLHSNYWYIYIYILGLGDSSIIINITIMTAIAKNCYRNSGHVYRHVYLTLSRLNIPTIKGKKHEKMARNICGEIDIDKEREDILLEGSKKDV